MLIFYGGCLITAVRRLITIFRCVENEDRCIGNIVGGTSNPYQVRLWGKTVSLMINIPV